MMRSKIWSKIILLVCLCLVPKYSVFCINFEEDNDRFGVDPIETEDRFGYFGDLMPPNFADFLSPLRRANDDDFEDIDRYGKGKADNDNEEDFRSYIGNVYNPNPKAKNIFDVLNADSDIDDVPIRSSNEQSLDDMDDDDDDDDEDDEGDRDNVKHPSMKLIRRISPSWDKSNESDWGDDRIIGKSASMKDSISRLIGLGHKSSKASPDDGESKKDGDSNDDDDDDDDDDDSDESHQKTTEMDGKSKGNIFSKLFSKSKKTSSDMDLKATTETKLTTEKSSASSQTTSSDEDDDDDDDEDESGDNSTSSYRTSTTKKSSESGSTIVTPLSSSTTDSTSTTSTTKKSKSHKHEETSSTSSTSAPDNISSTEKVTKKHHKSHTSTITLPSTTLAYKTSEISPKNKDKEGSEDDENKSGHKSSLEIIEAFLAGLGHESHHTKDNHNSTEAPSTKSPKHSKTHKKKHGKKHKKTTDLIPEPMSTALEETGSNSSSTAEKPENKSTTGTEVSSSIRSKGDTTTAMPTSTTDSGASFPVISITRTTSNEKYPTTDSSTTESNANSNSQGSSTTPIPTLGPYVEDSDDIIVTDESIVYSDWNPDVFP